MAKELTTFTGLCISAASGGGGKTILSLGLGRALKRRGYLIKPFKKGPDYIDSAWLSMACGTPATNLDPFFLDPVRLRQLFFSSLESLNASTDGPGPFSLLEGNRGLYDGLDEYGSCSTSNLARLLDLPILLILNCEKISRTISALVKGLTTFEDKLSFCGLILNRVGSERHSRALCKAIEHDTDLKVLGIIPRLSVNPLPERHMGLASRGPSLAEKAEELINKLADLMEENCSLDKLLSSLGKNIMPEKAKAALEIYSCNKSKSTEEKVRIAYAHDSAFWFYYPENLQALQDAGAELVPLKIINAGEADLESWKNLDGLYLGGGFPEDFPAELEASPILDIIAGYAKSGLPIYAECGGMMLLCASLNLNGRKWQMCNIFDHEIDWHKKPQGLGYVEGSVIRENPFFPMGQLIKGHEFHYSGFTPRHNGQEYAMMLKRGAGLGKSETGKHVSMDALLYKNVWASYTHIFAPALPCWAENFVKAGRKWKNRHAPI